MNRITLFDLHLSHGATISPFVWATRYAVAHKGLEADLVPGGFTGIMERTGGRSERLPVIVDQGEWVLDSWLIAEHLDRKYPDRPTLIGDPSVKVLAQFLESWLWQTAIGPWMTCYLKNYRDWSMPVDHDYVTTSRERMFGRKIEDIVVGREDRLPLVPPQLELLRTILKTHHWLGGDAPNYADYRALSVFLFCASVADTPPLTDDDPLRDWIERGLDLHGGLGRHSGLKPLFGLKLRDGDPQPFAKGPTMAGGLVSRNTGPQSTAAETARITGRD